MIRDTDFYSLVLGDQFIYSRSPLPFVLAPDWWNGCGANANDISMRVGKPIENGTDSSNGLRFTIFSPSSSSLGCFFTFSILAFDYKWNTSSFLFIFFLFFRSCFHQAPPPLPTTAKVRELIFHPLSIDFLLLLRHLLDELLLLFPYLVHLAVQWKYLIVFHARFLLNFLKKLPCVPRFLLLIPVQTDRPTNHPPSHVKAQCCRANYCAMTPAPLR